MRMPAHGRRPDGPDEPARGRCRARAGASAARADASSRAARLLRGDGRAAPGHGPHHRLRVHASTPAARAGPRRARRRSAIRYDLWDERYVIERWDARRDSPAARRSRTTELPRLVALAGARLPPAATGLRRSAGAGQGRAAACCRSRRRSSATHRTGCSARSARRRLGAGRSRRARGQPTAGGPLRTFYGAHARRLDWPALADHVLLDRRRDHGVPMSLRWRLVALTAGDPRCPARLPSAAPAARRRPAGRRHRPGGRVRARALAGRPEAARTGRSGPPSRVPRALRRAAGPREPAAHRRPQPGGDRARASRRWCSRRRRSPSSASASGWPGRRTARRAAARAHRATRWRASGAADRPTSASASAAATTSGSSRA